MFHHRLAVLRPLERHVQNIPTIGKQSVSAITPKFRSVVSGPSAAHIAPCHPRGAPASNAPSALSPPIRSTDRRDKPCFCPDFFP